MELRTWLDGMTRKERGELAGRIGTTLNYLEQLHYGCKRPGHEMARKLHAESGKRVPLARMRPDIWGGAPPSATTATA